MRKGLRQSMAWLHTWSGLLLGWLLFAVFLTGTLAFFRQEITFWMQPETHIATPAPHAAERGLARLAELAPRAESWIVELPDARSPLLGLAWRPEGAPAGRRGFERATLDPASGARLHPRETAGGDFLYRFHFELYGLPRTWARWIVGIATAAMLVAIVSGIITHRRIFADFFTFRPNKAGQRAWLDAHNAAAVLGLPFHLMITYSGLVLFTATLLPWALDDSGRHRRAAPETPAVEAAAAAPVRLVEVAPLLAEAERRWGMQAGRIAIERPAGPDPEIELAPLRNRDLTAHSGSGSLGVERLRFDGTSGALLGASANDGLSVAHAVNNAMGSLHRARFASPALRWLFFLAGAAGTVMVGSGLVLWTVKRRPQHSAAGQPDVGFRLVEHLNVGAIAGLLLAVGAYFWANRLLPAALEGRAEAEIGAFFAAWAVALLYPLARPIRRAWAEELGLAALLVGTLPLLNAATGGRHLAETLIEGRWQLAGFDLVALASGLTLAAAARKMARPAAVRRRGAARRQAPAPEGAVDA